jgi:putative flippase GtrA
MAGNESRSRTAPQAHPSRRVPLAAATASLRRTVTRGTRSFLDRLGMAWGAMLRRLPQRFHAITDEVAKFGTIGLINLGVNFAVFNALLLIVAGSEVKAKAVATVVAVTSAYFLNRYWTYRHRPKTTLRREYSLFFFFNAIGLLIETGIVALAKYGFDQTSWLVLNICTFVGIALGTIFRFWAYRTHVFKPASPEPAAPSVAAPPVLASGAPTDLPHVAELDPLRADAVGERSDARSDADQVIVGSAERLGADASGPADGTLADGTLPEEAVADDEALADKALADKALADELVEIELDRMLNADAPVRR